MQEAGDIMMKKTRYQIRKDDRVRLRLIRDYKEGAWARLEEVKQQCRQPDHNGKR
jgi:DNA-directed RNA polymerase subunit E'/Rpb7